MNDIVIDRKCALLLSHTFLMIVSYILITHKEVFSFIYRHCACTTEWVKQIIWTYIVICFHYQFWFISSRAFIPIFFQLWQILLTVIIHILTDTLDDKLTMIRGFHQVRQIINTFWRVWHYCFQMKLQTYLCFWFEQLFQCIFMLF